MEEEGGRRGWRGWKGYIASSMSGYFHHTHTHTHTASCRTGMRGDERDERKGCRGEGWIGGKE